MAITRASGFPAYGTNADAVTIVNAGDLMIAATWSFPDTATVSAVTSTRVPTWTNTVTFNDTTNGIWLAIWTGVSASAGTDTVTFTQAGGAPSFDSYVVDELTSSGASWSTHVTGSNSGATGTTLTFPSLTAGDNNSAYWGFCTTGSGTLSAGTTTGFTYAVQGGETAIVNDFSLANGTAYQPTMPVSASTDWDTIAMIISTGSPSVATANFFPFFLPVTVAKPGVPINITPPVIT